jgi:PKD repeat protein
MRSLPLKAATFFIVAGAWACGSDKNTGPNTSPVANFTAPTCTVNVACAFTDQSSDPDGSITAWSWNFGDNTAVDANQNPTHTFTAANTYQVTLTVTDNGGATNSKTLPVTVTAGGNNQLPVASFDLPTCTAGTPCGFHSTSTDADGQITATHWDFGDGQVADGVDATHTFGAPGTVTVTLTVTDNAGGTGTSSQQLTVAAQASQDCTTSPGGLVDCTLIMTQKSTVAISVVSHSCELQNNRLDVTLPRQQTAFFNLCSLVLPAAPYTVKDANGAPIVFNAGDPISLRFTQGTAKPGDPAKGDPGIQVINSFPEWTLNVDDGGAAASPNEPDFNDVVLKVTATPAP